jgi:hypothetical protein
VIKAGGVYNDIIHVFRGGKQWRFDNKPTEDKPFGNLLDGAYKAKNNWTGIHFPGGAGDYGPGAFVMVYKNKWSKWGKPSKTPVAGDIRDHPIGKQDDDDLADHPDPGALILVDPKKGRYGKIKGPNVCFLFIRNNVANWDGKCKPVGEDEYNFPPDIIAAALNKDKDWYFVERNGTYCKRKDVPRKEPKVQVMFSELLYKLY